MEEGYKPKPEESYGDKETEGNVVVGRTLRKDLVEKHLARKTRRFYLQVINVVIRLETIVLRVIRFLSNYILKPFTFYL